MSELFLCYDVVVCERSADFAWGDIQGSRPSLRVCDWREANASAFKKPREVSRVCFLAWRRKQKQFAMLAVRLSDMLWMLQFLTPFLLIQNVGGTENGMFGFVNSYIYWSRWFKYCKGILCDRNVAFLWVVLTRSNYQHTTARQSVCYWCFCGRSVMQATHNP